MCPSHGGNWECPKGTKSPHVPARWPPGWGAHRTRREMGHRKRGGCAAKETRPTPHHKHEHKPQRMERHCTGPPAAVVLKGARAAGTLAGCGTGPILFLPRLIQGLHHVWASPRVWASLCVWDSPRVQGLSLGARLSVCAGLTLCADFLVLWWFGLQRPCLWLPQMPSDRGVCAAGPVDQCSACGLEAVLAGFLSVQVEIHRPCLEPLSTSRVFSVSGSQDPEERPSGVLAGTRWSPLPMAGVWFPCWSQERDPLGLSEGAQTWWVSLACCGSPWEGNAGPTPHLQGSSFDVL